MLICGAEFDRTDSSNDKTNQEAVSKLNTTLNLGPEIPDSSLMDSFATSEDNSDCIISHPGILVCTSSQVSTVVDPKV